MRWIALFCGSAKSWLLVWEVCCLRVRVCEDDDLGIFGDVMGDGIEGGRRWV